MLSSFGVGTLFGISLVIAALVMIKREEPKGCLIYFGGVLLFFILLGLIIGF